MPTVLDVAQIWQLSGVSVIPIQANGTKRPATSWAQYMSNVAPMANVKDWWGNGQEYGIALICGSVSGNLEMCEIEGRALEDQSALLHIIGFMDEGGAGPVWDLLTGPNGYAEDSPSGGMHLLYRIRDHEVPGNTKIAANEERVVLAETRGEGGYVIVAPTPGHCHPSGEPWRLVNGSYGHLPEITWDERNLLHECLKAALDKTPPPLPVVTRSNDGYTDGAILFLSELSPGDDFERQTDWEDILKPHGWQVVMSTRDGERHWVRPGKDPRDGMSATTGRANDRDRLYVFSTSTEFEAEVPYTKFGAYSLLNYGGDHSRAASALARKGFGTRRSIEDTVDVGEWEPPGDVPVIGDYSEDDTGNAQLLADTIRGRYRYIWEEKAFYYWNGRVWVSDVGSSVIHEWTALTRIMIQQGRDKWATRSRDQRHISAAVNLSKSSLTHSSRDWAPNRDLLNVRNGILNPKTLEFVEHAPQYLMVHTFGTSYIPGATCARFERFMADAVPNPDIRAYMQRALAYSMLGSPDQRSIFLVHGPSGTGKSTLIETIKSVFGEYAATAGSGTFRANNNSGAPSPDLHVLRGRRFVTTSETSETTMFNEDLLKQISGRDSITSRPLYGQPVEWIPECVLWVATNNPPRFNSDDNAIWKRTKLIPFTTVFQGAGEVSDYAHKFLVPEGPGILNWLLEGLRQFLEDGLDAPSEIETLAREQRNESDPVARFVLDRQADGLLQVGPEHEVQCQDLLNQYLSWCAQVGERGRLSGRRFNHRLMSLLPELQRKEGAGRPVWQGIGYRVTGSWMTTPPNLFED
jgi:putative DNA primase/helicase